MNADRQDFKYKKLTEKIYENAMMIEFRREGIPAVAQSPIKVFYEGEIIGEYYADILVDNEGNC